MDAIHLKRAVENRQVLPEVSWYQLLTMLGSRIFACLRSRFPPKQVGNKMATTLAMSTQCGHIVIGRRVNVKCLPINGSSASEPVSLLCEMEAKKLQSNASFLSALQ